MSKPNHKTQSLRKLGVGVVIAVLAALVTGTNLEARAGLQSKFGIVTIENLQPGETYNTREIANLPLIVRNTGDKDTTVRIDLLKPQPDSPGLLKEKYEVIPDTSWISISNNELEIHAGESQGTDVMITVPDDDKYLGKRYQVDLHIRSLSKEFIAVALRANLRFTVAPRRLTKDEADQRKKVEKFQKIDFDLLPTKGNVEGPVPLGKEVDLDKEKKVSLKISNPNDADFLYYLDVVHTVEVDMRIAPGYEEIPLDFVILKNKDVKVPANSIKKIPLAVKIPNEEKYKGRNFLFLIRGRVAGTPVELNQVSVFYLTTEK